MAVARICPVSGQSLRKLAKNTGTTKSRVGQAAIVLEFAPDLADSIMSGARSLDDAYKTAQQRKHEADLS